MDPLSINYFPDCRFRDRRKCSPGNLQHGQSGQSIKADVTGRDSLAVASDHGQIRLRARHHQGATRRRRCCRQLFGQFSGRKRKGRELDFGGRLRQASRDSPAIIQRPASDDRGVRVAGNRCRVDRIKRAARAALPQQEPEHLHSTQAVNDSHNLRRDALIGNDGDACRRSRRPSRRSRRTSSFRLGLRRKRSSRRRLNRSRSSRGRSLCRNARAERHQRRDSDNEHPV